MDMAFVKSDLDKEKNELNKLVSEEESARKAYEEFQARIALQQQLVQMRKAEHMTQSDVAHAAGLSQQAVSRIEKGVIHCYSYSPELAGEFVKLGYYIGIGGVVTFKNSKKLKETVKICPLHTLVLETDCPYLAPEPHRGERNSSVELPYVAAEIARLKELREAEVIEATYRNALSLYGITG